MKKLLLVFTLVVFTLPATAAAKGPGGGHKNAAKHCKALRAEMGAEAFRAMFGTKRGKNALGRCVSTQRRARNAARKRARRACRAEGVRGRAMKRCMRSKLAEDPAPTPADYSAAVEECRADQAEDPEGFAEEYGTGPNAISKCVADELADGAEDEGEDEPAEPEDEFGEDEDVPADESDPDEL